MDRVLIANRGEIARRLIHYFAEQEIETVVIFSEPDAEQPWLDEADYAQYLNGKTVPETYMNVQRVLSAAFDSGCDAIHPGYCFLAERNEFFEVAMAANMAIIGPSASSLARMNDRFILRAAASELGIPLIPASDPLSEDEDGLAVAAQLGLPLFVKAVQGGALRRVSRLQDVPAAVYEIRAAAEVTSGDPSVYLEREVEALRHCGTIVVADMHGNCQHLGTSDGSLQVGYGTWIEEMGEEVVGEELHDRLGAAAVDLCQALDWVGVGRVRWIITPDGGWYLLGFSARLTTGYSLAEQLYGVDLVHTQYRILDEEELGWEQSRSPERHGVQLRLLHVDPADGHSRPDGVLERFVLPEGVTCEVGTEEGQPCTRDTDPLLAKITVTAPTRSAALVRAKAALAELVVEGVVTNRELLVQALGDEVFWRGEHDTGTLQRLISSN